MSARINAGALPWLCLLAGCAVGPTYHQPPAPPLAYYNGAADPQQTVVADGSSQRFIAGAALEGDWWRLFGSPDVDRVLADALGSNPGLQAAQAGLRASQATLRAGYGIFYPQAALDAAATRQRYSPAKVGQSASGSIFNLYTLSASVSYALDLFGGQRRLVEGLRAQTDLSRANARAAYLTLSTNLVNALIARAAYRAQVQDTQALIELQREQVSLANAQVEAGTAAYAGLLALRAQLATSEASVPQLEQKLTQTEDLLATLAGHAPAEWRAPDLTLSALTLPVDLPVSLPSELVKHRPDIMAADAIAHVACADVGVATAAMLPSITLSGSLGANAQTIGSLAAANSRFWGVAAGAAVPVFAGGSLYFRRRAAVENYVQASALYRQTVLQAFAQVADALRALDHDAATLLAESAALSSAAEALQLIHANYAAGLVTYGDVLIADAQWHQAKVAEIQARAVRFQDTVALYAALGGGWWNAR